MEKTLEAAVEVFENSKLAIWVGSEVMLSIATGFKRYILMVSKDPLTINFKVVSSLLRTLKGPSHRDWMARQTRSGRINT